MGRQLQVLLDPTDEDSLLEFLSSTVPIRIYRTFGPNPDGLWVGAFRDVPGYSSFGLWPTSFPWRPEYIQTNTGEYYIRNAGAAPVLEYSRAPVTLDNPGRLYWAKDLSGMPTYDSAAFDRWIDSVWRWVRRTAHSGSVAGLPSVWIFPAARARLAASAHGAA